MMIKARIIRYITAVVIVAAVFALTQVSYAKNELQQSRFDLDSDGAVNIADVTCLLNYLAGAQGEENAEDTSGMSAFDLAVRYGFVGTEEQWLESVVNASEIQAASYGVFPGEVEKDRMEVLLSLGSQYGAEIRFGNGEYVFSSTLNVESDTTLVGSANTVFRLNQESKDKTLISVGNAVDNVFFSHLILKGSATEAPSSQGEETGMKVVGAARVNIENVEFSGFSGYGLYASKMSSTTVGEFCKMMQITNCRFTDNYCGMCLGPRCEYTQTLNCVFGKNYYGCINQGGNNNYVSCIFNVNRIGFRMDSAGLSNPAHGGCNACTFNHNSDAMIINDCAIGWVFNGCQIFYGNVKLNNCKGVIFDSSIFGSCTFYSVNPTSPNANMISDCFFQTDRAAILRGNDGSTFVYNCLPDLLPIEEPENEETGHESEWTRLVYTQAATSGTGASINAYFGTINDPIPAGSEIGVLDIAVTGATGAGQSVNGVDIWIGNARTGEVIEHLVNDETLKTSYSQNLGKYVLRIGLNRSYDFPVFFVVEATRTSNVGIAYGRSASAVNYFSDQAVTIGDVLTANSSYIPEIAVYAPVS